MEIKRWLCCAVNCALVCCLVAKPVSLNKIIEAESQLKAVTISPKLEESEPAAERFSLNKGLKPLSRISKKHKELGTNLNLISLSKKISPFKYRKTYQIKSPLKPKRVKHSLRTRHRQKNQSVKREIDGNAILSQKYIPLLRSLGMLFDNILGSDSGESYELAKNKRKRYRYYPEENNDVEHEALCKCREGALGDSESKEETVAFSETIPSEIPIAAKAPTKATDYTPISDIRSFRQNKDVPLLLPRNTSSARRNNHGLGERSGTSHNGSAERYLPWDNGNSEYNTQRGQDKSNAQSDEEHTDSHSRNNAGGIRAGRVRIIRGEEDGKNSEDDEINTIQEDETESLDYGYGRGHTNQFDRQINVEIRRDEAESARLLSKPFRKQRGFISEGKVDKTAKSVQSEEDDQKSGFSLSHDNAGDQRFPDGNGPLTAEIQKADPKHETINRHAIRLEKPRNVTETHTSPRKGPEFDRQDNVEIQNEAESAELLSTPVREQRVSISESEKDDHKSGFSHAHDNSGNQRFPDENGPIQKADPKHETINRHAILSEKPRNVTETNTLLRKGPEFDRQDKIEIQKNEAESAGLHSNPVRKQRVSISEGKVDDTTESVQSEEDDQISGFGLAHDSTRVERFPDGIGPLTAETPKADPKYETIIRHGIRLVKPLNITATKTSPRKGPELDRRDKVEIQRNEAESAGLHSKPVQKQRGFISKGKVDDNAESVQSEEDDQKSEFSLAYDSADDQRFPDENGSIAAEIQKSDPGHKTIIRHALRLEKPRKVTGTNTSPRNGPVLVIIDGYSVTRHKNGENKLTEKAIHYKP